MKNTLALAAIVVAAIAAAVAFTLTNHAVPAWDSAVILAGVGALGGVLIPGPGQAQSGDVIDLVHHVVSEIAGLAGGPVAAGSQPDASPVPVASTLPEPAPATDAPPAAGT